MSILQPVTELDTSSQRQIPELSQEAYDALVDEAIAGIEQRQTRPRLSAEAIAQLRAARELRNRTKGNPNCPEFTQALEQACKELGIRTPVERKGGKGSFSTKQMAWNEAIAAIDEACPDWRGYTVQVNHDVSKWVAA